MAMEIANQFNEELTYLQMKDRYGFAFRAKLRGLQYLSIILRNAGLVEESESILSMMDEQNVRLNADRGNL